MNNKSESKTQHTLKLYQQRFSSKINLQKVKKNNEVDFQIFELYNIFSESNKGNIDFINCKNKVEKIKQNPLNSTQQALIEEISYIIEVLSNKNENDQNIEKAQLLLDKYPFLVVTKYYQLRLFIDQNNQVKIQEVEQEIITNFSQYNFILLYIIGYYYFYKNYQKALDLTNLIHGPLLKLQLKLYIIRNMGFPKKIVGWLPEILFCLITPALIFINIYISAIFIGIFLGIYRKKSNLNYLTKMGQYYFSFGIASLVIILILVGIVSIFSFIFFPNFHNFLYK